MAETIWSEEHGEALRERRRRRGITQEELAELAGVSTRTVRALEQGDREPHLSTIRLVAEALGCHPDDLFDKRVHPPSQPRPVGGRLHDDAGGDAAAETALDVVDDPDLVIFPGGREPAGRRRTRIALLITLVIAALVIAISVDRLTREPDIPVDALDPFLVAVAVFDNRSGDAALDGVGQLIGDRIVAGISAAALERGGSRVRAMRLSVDGERANASRSDRARSLARASAAGVVIAGFYGAHGDSVRFNASIHDLRQDRNIYAVRAVTAARATPAAAIEVLTDRTLGALAAHFDFHVPSPHAAPPPSFAAYREFRAAIDLIQSENLVAVWFQATSEEEARPVIQHYERALELDPRFTEALFALKSFYQFYMQDPARADSCVARVTQLREQLTPFESAMLAASAAGLERNYPRALRNLRRALKLDPDNQNVRMWVGLAAQVQLRPREAVEMLEPVDRIPGGRPRLAHLCWSYHHLREYEKELATAREYQRRYPDSAIFSIISAVPPLAALGEVEEIGQVLEQCLTLPQSGPSAARAAYGIAIGELRWHGHPEEAAPLAARAVDYYSSRPADETAEVDLRMNRAECSYFAERWDDARALYEQLAEEFPGVPWYKVRLGTLAARRGDREEALRIADELHQIKYFASCARIAALLGERARAVELIRESRRHGAWYTEPHANMDFESLRGLPAFDELMRPQG